MDRRLWEENQRTNGHTDARKEEMQVDVGERKRRKNNIQEVKERY